MSNNQTVAFSFVSRIYICKNKIIELKLHKAETLLCSLGEHTLFFNFNWL